MKDESNETQHFNIALFPMEQKLLDDCVHFAQANLSLAADGYLLGNDAWPHITLCPFVTDVNHLPKIWSSTMDLQKQPLSLRFDHLYIKPGVSEHSGKYWVGLAVEREPRLIELQAEIYVILTDHGIEPLTEPSTYFPHITWARCDGMSAPTLRNFLDQEFWQRSFSYTMSLGKSDSNGVYRERLYTAMP